LSTAKKSSLELFRLRKTLNSLASKEGSHTELITVYVPPGKQISDALNLLRNEYGTASNIKSNVTEKTYLMLSPKLSKNSNCLRIQARKAL